MTDIISTLKNRAGDNIYPNVGGFINDSITTDALANSAVVTSKIDRTVPTSKIANSGVATADIANNAVTTAKISDSGVATGDIANLAVTTAKIADLGITTADIAGSAATGPKRNPTRSTVSCTIKNVTTGASSTSSLTKIDFGGGLVAYIGYISGPNITNETFNRINISYPSIGTVYAYDVHVDGAGTPNTATCYSWASATLVDVYTWLSTGGTPSVASQIYISVIGKTS